MTTEKDWVRIENLGIHEDKLCYLTVGFELLADRAGFFKMVAETVHSSGLKVRGRHLQSKNRKLTKAEK